MKVSQAFASLAWFMGLVVVSRADQTSPATILAQGFVAGNVEAGSQAQGPQYPNNFLESRLVFDHNKVRVALEMTLQLRTNGFHVNATDEIKVRLPRFTSGGASGADGPSFKIHQHSWATLFDVYFECGAHTDSQSLPFPETNLTLRVKQGRVLEPRRPYEVVIAASNGLMAICSFLEGDPLYTISTNASKAFTDNPQPMAEVSPLGPACTALDNCNGHGVCDPCRQRCTCDEGYGKPLPNGKIPRDISVDCSRRTCQVGRAVRALAKSRVEAHSELEECSANGLCDRDLGTCICAPGWGGTACERALCPNECSGHGQCMAMAELAREPRALPLAPTGRGGAFPTYGTAQQRNFGAWDYLSMHGCVCDSRWAVGLGDGETQEPEWFGGDCGLRRCPTGDDPRTAYDETNCTGVTPKGGTGVGERGNRCHVDCSNRGRCDYATGTCACFEGFYGDNCGLMSVLASQKSSGP